MRGALLTFIMAIGSTLQMETPILSTEYILDDPCASAGESSGLLIASAQYLEKRLVQICVCNSTTDQTIGRALAAAYTRIMGLDVLLRVVDHTAAELGSWFCDFSVCMCAQQFRPKNQTGSANSKFEVIRKHCPHCSVENATLAHHKVHTIECADSRKQLCCCARNYSDLQAMYQEASSTGLPVLSHPWNEHTKGEWPDRNPHLLFI